MRVRSLMVPLAASVVLLAGCTQGDPGVQATPTPTTNGAEALDAEGIIDAAVYAVMGAESFRMSGSIGAPPENLDVDLVYAGDNAMGTVTYFGVEIDLIKIGDDVYVNADASLYAAFIPDEQQSLLDQLNNTWVKASASIIGSVVPLPLVPEDLFSDDMVVRPLTKGEVGEHDGMPVVTVSDAEGSVYTVAIQGEPYVLQITTDGGPVTFSGYGEPVDIQPPDEAIDILALLGMG